MRLAHGTGLALHLTLAAFLAWMGASVLRLVVADVQSGYIPPAFDFIVLLGTAPLVLAVGVVVGVVVSVRSSRFGLLLLADGVTSVAAWTLLIPLVFLPGDRLTVVLFLAPACTAFVVWHSNDPGGGRPRRRGRRRVTRGRWRRA